MVSFLEFTPLYGLNRPFPVKALHFSGDKSILGISMDEDGEFLFL